MKFLAIFLVSVAVSCASPAPEEKFYYLLRDELVESNGAQRSQSTVGISRVSVSAYLDQSGLALETARHAVRPARNHLWAEPLDQGVAVYLRSAVSAALGEELGDATASRAGWKQEVRIFVDQLHGTMSGHARLVASYQIVGPGSSLAEYRYAQEAELQSEGYGALVAAEKALLKQLGQAIADSIRETR